MTEQQMHPVVSIEQHNIALLFTNYLTSQGFTAALQQHEQQFVVFCAEHQVARAQQEFQQFKARPFDEKYQQAAWQQGEVTDVKSNQPSFVSVFKAHFIAHAGLVTLPVFILCWAIYLASIFGFFREIFSGMQFFKQLSVDAILAEPYRLFTPAFIHFSLLHIAFNTMWWWQLGGDVERVLGKASLINLLLVSALVSNLGQFVTNGPNFGGLSGVVYALVGYVWWCGWLKPHLGLTVSKPIVGILLVWMLLGFAELLPINMANMAHLLGLVSGCLLAYLKTRNIAEP